MIYKISKYDQAEITFELEDSKVSIWLEDSDQCMNSKVDLAELKKVVVLLEQDAEGK